MSDSTDTPVEAPVEAVAEPEAVDEGDGQADTKASREARYRTRLRETEAERDNLAQRLQAAQRQQVEGLLGAGIKAEAFWLCNTLDGLLGEDGTIDRDAVTAAAEATRRQLGIPSGLHIPQERQATRATTGPSFSDAFKPGN